MRWLLLASLVVAGCAGGAPATTSAPPSASPTVAPAEPSPSTTADDEAIAELIKDSTDELLERLGGLDGTEAEIAETLKGLRDFASRTETRLALRTPSTCTEEAVAHFRDALSSTTTFAQDFLDWMAAGAAGEFDTSTARQVGQKFAAANTALSAPC